MSDAATMLQRCIDHAPDAVLITDDHGVIRYVNEAFEQEAGMSAQTLVGHTPRVIKPLRRDRAAFRLLAETVLAGKVHRGRTMDARNDVRVIHEHTVAPVRDDAGRITHFIATVRLLDPAAPADRLERAYDPLTQLPLWPVLAERARPVLARARREDRPAALMVIGVDSLNALNEKYGREVGRQLLRILGHRLQVILRESDIPARLPGHGFTALLQDVADDEILGHAADRIHNALSQPVSLEDGRTLDLRITLGIAMYPRDGSTLHELLDNANDALTRARQAAVAFDFHQPDLGVRARDNVHLAGELRVAADSDQFVLHFQPIVATVSGRLVGAEALARGNVVGLEALARWPHEEKGWVPPSEFIPLAEATGRILALDRWAIGTAIGRAQQWWQNGWPGWISVNLSARSLHDPELARYIDGLLRSRDIDASRLCLEVTEGTAMSDPDLTARLLRSLKGVGVRIAIDDFGIGHSSLAYLKRFPVDVVKLDRSFVADIGKDDKDEKLIEAIIALAHRIGAQFLAEGVEEKTQLAWLRSVGCDLVQGYLLGRPAPPEEIPTSQA